jgi:hypothetical protein
VSMSMWCCWPSVDLLSWSPSIMIWFLNEFSLIDGTVWI